MVDQNEVYLKIKITYKDKIMELKLKELTTLDKIKDKVLETFRIPPNKKDCIYFSYQDEEGDINPLEENDDLFELSTEQSNDSYVLELALYIGDNLEESKKGFQDYILSHRNLKTTENKLITSKDSSNIDKSKVYESILLNQNSNENINENINENKNENILSENKDNNIKIESDVEQLKNELYKKEKENEELRKKIEEMKKIKIEKLEQEMKEIKNRKEKKRKIREEKNKKLELINKNKGKIEKHKKEIENLKLNIISNIFKNHINDDIMPLFEEKIKNYKNIFENIINNLDNNKLDNIKVQINKKILEINEINKNVNNKINSQLKNNLEKIKDDIEIIKKKIIKKKENINNNNKDININSNNNIINNNDNRNFKNNNNQIYNKVIINKEDNNPQNYKNNKNLNISNKDLEKKNSDKNLNNDIKNTLINSFKEYLNYFFFQLNIKDINENEKLKIEQYYYELKKNSENVYPASIISNFYHGKVIPLIQKNHLSEKIQKIYYSKQKFLTNIFSNLEKQNDINNSRDNKNLNPYNYNKEKNFPRYPKNNLYFNYK